MKRIKMAGAYVAVIETRDGVGLLRLGAGAKDDFHGTTVVLRPEAARELAAALLAYGETKNATCPLCSKPGGLHLECSQREQGYADWVSEQQATNE
jgi:hypothetical protein